MSQVRITDFSSNVLAIIFGGHLGDFSQRECLCGRSLPFAYCETKICTCLRKLIFKVASHAAHAVLIVQYLNSTISKAIDVQ